jgi:hypothetical protein
MRVWITREAADNLVRRLLAEYMKRTNPPLPWFGG